MTQDKAQKTAIRQRMAETGEPYSVARRAVQAPEPATAEDWDEEYYADGAASEGISVEEFKAREAERERREQPAVHAQAGGVSGLPPLRDVALAGRRLIGDLRHELRQQLLGAPPAPPRPPGPTPPVPPGFPGAARRTVRPRPAPLTEDQARDLGPFLEAAGQAADKAQEAAALAQEWADRAQEQAVSAQERADQAQEQADLVEEGADDEEQEGSAEAQQRVERAQQLAELAQEQADEAEERAGHAQEWAELAQERADEAREWADKAGEWPAV